MKVTKTFWRKIPLHIRILIIAVLAHVFVFVLLIVSCSGSIDNYTAQLDEIAKRSSEAFAIKWQQEGDLQEIYDFDNGEQPKTVGVMYLVAKKTVRFSGLTIGTSTLATDVSVKVFAVGLPADEEQEEGEQEQPEDETEIGDITLKSGSYENNVALHKTYVIPENLIIIIHYTPDITLEFIGVSWSENISGD